MSVDLANFAPVAARAPVYGACRPGHFGGDVDAWTAILGDAGVTDVVCLLSEPEARRWGLPAAYDDAFQTHHVPITDRHLPTPGRLQRAVDVLERAVDRGDRAAIHCNAGLGRTGIVGAAWLVHARDLAPSRAVELVSASPGRRTPTEAVRDDNATEAELYDLLAGLR